jgi:hypothetical protein
MNKTEAYAQAYKHKGKRKTMSDNASRLSNDSRIQAEIEALERAKQFEAMYSDRQLRTLVISQLTKEAIDPKSKPSERIAALGKLGQVAELGVFVQRTETKVIKDSESAKTDLMEQLKKALADDARTIDNDADELMRLIASPSDSPAPAIPPVPDQPFDEIDGTPKLHSTPDKQSSTFSSPDKQSQEFSAGEGVENSEDVSSSSHRETPPSANWTPKG